MRFPYSSALSRSQRFALDLSSRTAAFVKLKILSRSGAPTEKVTSGPAPPGKRITAVESPKKLRRKSGGREMVVVAGERQSSAQALKKFQKEVPSTTAWLAVQPMNTAPSPSSVN
ncbi:hypothetical protein IEQ34_016993 [Dendrobium chrysotoxum]|uniref:Uncharacterized protein n=1 Tax=Dendrobium chrysotoxum TaxID=161865 RepID=A0AAV7FZR9_DENCH|nr:hypothetical protein IEQ34_016993 [Dendrobium chrysotoxum]